MSTYDGQPSSLVPDIISVSTKSKKMLLYFKKLYGSFLWMGFNCLKARVTLRRQFTFYHYHYPYHFFFINVTFYHYHYHFYRFDLHLNINQYHHFCQQKGNFLFIGYFYSFSFSLTVICMMFDVFHIFLLTIYFLSFVFSC